MPRRMRKRQYRRRTATTDARGYGADWQRLRNAFIATYPLCVGCWVAGKMEPATHVDHVTPFSGKDDAQRLDWDNLQSLCHRCHMGPKAAIQGRCRRQDVAAEWAKHLRTVRTCDDAMLGELPESIQQSMQADNTVNTTRQRAFSMGWREMGQVGYGGGGGRV